jgi:hypothetical protein
MFSTNEVSQVQVNKKFSILTTDAMEVGQQTPVLLKHKGVEPKLCLVKTEKEKRKNLIIRNQ